MHSYIGFHMESLYCHVVTLVALIIDYRLVVSFVYLKASVICCSEVAGAASCCRGWYTKKWRAISAFVLQPWVQFLHVYRCSPTRLEWNSYFWGQVLKLSFFGFLGTFWNRNRKIKAKLSASFRDYRDETRGMVYGWCGWSSPKEFQGLSLLLLPFL